MSVKLRKLIALFAVFCLMLTCVPANSETVKALADEPENTEYHGDGREYHWSDEYYNEVRNYVYGKHYGDYENITLPGDGHRMRVIEDSYYLLNKETDDHDLWTYVFGTITVSGDTKFEAWPRTQRLVVESGVTFHCVENHWQEPVTPGAIEYIDRYDPSGISIQDGGEAIIKGTMIIDDCPFIDEHQEREDDGSGEPNYFYFRPGSTLTITNTGKVQVIGNGRLMMGNYEAENPGATLNIEGKGVLELTNNTVTYTPSTDDPLFIFVYWNPDDLITYALFEIDGQTSWRWYENGGTWITSWGEDWRPNGWTDPGSEFVVEASSTGSGSIALTAGMDYYRVGNTVKQLYQGAELKDGVNVTFTPASGYQLSSVKIDGTAVALDSLKKSDTGYIYEIRELPKNTTTKYDMEPVVTENDKKIKATRDKVRPDGLHIVSIEAAFSAISTSVPSYSDYSYTAPAETTTTTDGTGSTSDTSTAGTTVTENADGTKTTTTENADGSSFESTVTTTAAGKVVAEVVTIGANGKLSITLETDKPNGDEVVKAFASAKGNGIKLTDYDTKGKTALIPSEVKGIRWQCTA
ncbi:MAG: hypothetical protein K6G81_11555 [Lachnospiraceae bacterium]|nr:hypothetical protein [Lachnospiraceae bacterium]